MPSTHVILAVFDHELRHRVVTLGFPGKCIHVAFSTIRAAGDVGGVGEGCGWRREGGEGD